MKIEGMCAISILNPSAVCMPKDISLYYTWNESVWNNLSFRIKGLLKHRTYLTGSDEVGAFCFTMSSARKISNQWPFCSTLFDYILSELDEGDK